MKIPTTFYILSLAIDVVGPKDNIVQAEHLMAHAQFLFHGEL
jgi:hypothetical protein